MAVTIKDVARKANVSVSAVSQVINGPSKKNRIGKDTRKKVLNIIKEAGYIPNHYARTMKKGKTDTVGVIIAGTSGSMEKLVEGVNSILAESRFYSILGLSQDQCQRGTFYLDNFLSRKVDGIIIVPTAYGGTMSKIESIHRSGFPIVVCERPYVTTVDSVFSNDEWGTYEATNHLINLGHKKVAICFGHLTDGPLDHSINIRYRGYQKSLEDNQIKIPREYFLTSQGVDISDGREVGHTIANLADRPTAVVFRNDEMAIGAMQIFNEKGIRVPEDISVIGFGNKPLTEALPIPLTTLEAPKYEVGKKAAELLLNKIKIKQEPDNSKNNTESVNSISILPKLIIRKSSCAPR